MTPEQILNRVLGDPKFGDPSTLAQLDQTVGRASQSPDWAWKGYSPDLKVRTQRLKAAQRRLIAFNNYSGQETDETIFWSEILGWAILEAEASVKLANPYLSKEGARDLLEYEEMVKAMVAWTTSQSPAKWVEAWRADVRDPTRPDEKYLAIKGTLGMPAEDPRRRHEAFAE